MRFGHHAALLLSYAAALLGALVLSRRLPRLWPAEDADRLARPGREVAWALGAGVVVLLIGMLYARGWLLPATSRSLPALDAINQLLIYAPFPLLLVLRRQSTNTAWLPIRGAMVRVAIGLILALLSLVVYAAVRPGLTHWLPLVGHVYQPGHISYLVQVLLEDISIAILFVRVQQALGLNRALLLVAILFAAAHIPGLLARGATLSELAPLAGDVALGVLALSVLHRLRDVWWFWMVHFALDMTQFYGRQAG